ncbi:OmpA family protein [Maritimibacter sp. HL-12]|uniref:OmpA family protein n=1 Tax=Maritimibacter sp. HL-12 TaxID=1162418 RepID=UPI000A0EEDFD|nr:OmpA family protein [Maritimibacter sp. HL-12]SMH51942.1 Outer membrane protein and related peptidoglycan-associated (lipo)proteins [Maritimibacter sp. HL-12]
MPNRFFSSLRTIALAIGLGITGLAFLGSAASAQEQVTVTGKINWGLWVDPDGCMHWWADGGLEGYMTPRRHPKTGQHMCLERNTCATPNTDVLFATDSHKLTPSGRQWLQQFFTSAGAFAYAVYGHTDSRASDEYNMRLSQRRADSVAGVARATGAVVDRVVGFGERRPIAPNDSAANMQKNRRVEIVCYRYPQ